MKRHLLSVNSYHYHRGGADNVYFAHAELMRRQGWDNTFYAMHHPQNLADADEAYFADQIDYASPGPLATKLTHAARIIYSPEARRKISALLDTRRIDITHVHNIYHHQSPSILMELRRRGIPTVMTAHDLKIACPAKTMLTHDGVCERCKGGRLWNVAVHRCIKDSRLASSLIMMESAVHQSLGWYRRYLDRIVTPSHFYRLKLIEWGWPADQVVHIPNFVPQGETPPPSVGGDHIAYFGRLSPEKGLATLVRAAALSGIPVKLAGRGPQEDELRAMATALQAPVEFVGFKSGSALQALIDASRAVVLPSEWYENGPLSAIEAFQRGRPLIGARIGGIPELIVDEGTGWSFQSGNAEDLASVMEHVMRLAPANLLAMSAACQDLVEQQYSAGRYYESMMSVYQDVVN